MNLSVSARAEQDLFEILDDLTWISPQAARDLNTQFAARLDQLTRLPKMGRLRSDLDDGLRGLLVSPYIVFYRVSNDEITIVRVLHGSRDLRQVAFREA